MSPVDRLPTVDALVLSDEHRDIDALLGDFLRTASSGALAQAVDAIARFDDALRVHMMAEEGLFPAKPPTLASSPDETEAEGFFRELRLEHVQIRELSAMIRRVLGESGDLAAAQSLAAGLARRWDAHTTREESEWLAR